MMPKRKLPFEILDSIRGIAALYVAIAHSRGVLWVGGNQFMKMFSNNEWELWKYATLGTSLLTRLAVEFVIVFFVLSGFSIAHSLSSNKSPIEFYKRRFVRIYPSYVIALLWAGVVFLVTRYWHPEWYDGTYREYAFLRTYEMNNYLDPGTAIKSLFYMPSGGFIVPFWSLTYEVMFYLLAPFLLRRVNTYLIVSAALFLFNFIFPGPVEKLSLPLYVSEYLFTYNIFFALGILLYKYYDIIAGWFKAYTRWEFMLIFVGFLVIMFGANIYLGVETIFTFIEAAMLSVILIIFFLKYEVRIPFLLQIGKLSYTLYITHFATIYLFLGVYWLIVQPDKPYIVNFFVWILAVPVVLGIAWLQYVLVEKQTKKRLGYMRAKRDGGGKQ